MPKYHIHVASRYSRLRNSIAEIIRSGRFPDDAKVIYTGRNTVYRFTIDGVDIVAKAFRAPNIVNSVVYTHLRKSKAERSYLNAKRLLQMGIRTPEPVAYGEEVVNGLLQRSYYFSLMVEGDDMRHWESKPDCEGLLKAFATDIVHLHDCGVLHKDFSPGNVIYNRDDDGAYRFYYIDLNRMEFEVTDRKRLMGMFRSINIDPQQTIRLAEIYATIARRNREDVLRQANEARDGYIAVQRRKHAFKRLFAK